MDSDIALANLREERAYQGRAGSDSNSTEGLRRRFPAQENARREFTLPQADTGKDAWLFLAGCFMVEALIWGKFSLVSMAEGTPILIYRRQGFPSPLVSSKNTTPPIHPSLPNPRALPSLVLPRQESCTSAAPSCLRLSSTGRRCGEIARL